jgi:outer membrane receptor protein involved in Fe transport
MKRTPLFFLWIATFFVLSLPAFAQHSVSGKVVDTEREPVVGAAVIPDGNIRNAVVTDLNGFYTITVSNPDCTLTFSAFGFASLEKAVNGATTLDVVLQIQAEEMEEVIKVAYGSQKKINLTGAVAQIGSKELKIAPSGNVSSLLSGKLPGLVTRQSSGQPGADGSNLYVRGLGAGDGQILVVVDGVVRSFPDISPEEIESITIL